MLAPGIVDQPRHHLGMAGVDQRLGHQLGQPLAAGHGQGVLHGVGADHAHQILVAQHRAALEDRVGDLDRVAGEPARDVPAAAWRSPRPCSPAPGAPRPRDRAPAAPARRSPPPGRRRRTARRTGARTWPRPGRGPGASGRAAARRRPQRSSRCSRSLSAWWRKSASRLRPPTAAVAIRAHLVPTTEPGTFVRPEQVGNVGRQA